MQRGKKVADPARKELMGTYRADRHGDIIQLVTPTKSVPVPPGYLSKEAVMVWKEEYPRVVACGAIEADSSTFARYCSFEAAYRGMILKGEVPAAAMLTVLRQYAELLGIAGVRSRLAKVGTPETATKPVFTVRK